MPVLGSILAWSLGAHVVFIVFENLLAPSATRHHELAVRAIRRGPFARLFWAGAIGGGVLAVAALPPALAGGSKVALAAAALVGLAASFAWEYVWVEAGQSVPLS